MVFTTIAYGAVHQVVLALTYVLLAVVVMLWALDCFRGGALRFSTSYLQIPLYGAAIFGLIQIIPFGTVSAGGVDGLPRTISYEPFATQVNALHFFGLAAFLSVMLVLINSASRLRKVAGFIVIFGSIFAFFAIIQSVLSPTSIYGIYDRPYAQPFGSFVSRNNFAGWMEMAVAVPLGMLFAGSVRADKKLLYITATVLMGISIVVSGSRGGLVALLAQVGFVLILTFARQKGRAWIGVLLAIAMVGVIIAGTAFVGGDSSLTRITDDTAVTSEASSRPRIWANTIKMIGENMPFGVGLGAYGAAYTKFDPSSGLERVDQAHNDFLQVLSDAGIVGGALGLLFLYLIFSKGLRASKGENDYRRGLAVGVFAGIFGVLIHSLFDFVLHTTALSLLFLVLLAVLEACARKFDDDVENEDPVSSRRSGRKSVGAVRKSLALKRV